MNYAVIIPTHLLEVLIVYNFWFSVLTPRFDKKKCMWVYFPVQTLSVVKNWFIFESVMLRTSLTAVVSVTLLLILFKEKWYEKLVIFVTYFLCAFFAEMAAMLLARYVYHCDMSNFMQSSLPYTMWQLTAFVFLLIFSIIALILLKKEKIKPGNRVTQYTYLYVSIQTLTLLLFATAMIQYQMMSTALFITLFVIIALSGVLGIVIYSALNRSAQKVAEMDYLEKETKIVNDHFRELKEQYTEFRSLRHDYLNHIRILKELNNPEKTAKYAGEIESKLSDMEKLSVCDNMALDALLSVKKRTAKQHCVRLMAEICNLENIQISDFDLCTVVSNLLDNAIEAAAKTEEKGVFMQISRKVGRLIITVKNNSLPIPLNMKSTKQDKKEHGIGMQNIRKTVEKYDGDYVYKYENGEFVASVNMVL